MTGADRFLMAAPDLLVPPSLRRRRGGTGDGVSLHEDLRWLDAVLGTDPAATPVRYRARVVDGELRLLIPLHPGVAAAAALHRPNEQRGLVQRAQSTVGRTAARLGILGHLPGRQLDLAPFALVGHLGAALGAPDATAAVTLGPRRRNRKPVLQLIGVDGRSLGFAKVGWSPLTTALVDTEGDILSLLDGRLPAPLVAPRVLHRGRWGDVSVTVASPLRHRPGRSGDVPGIVDTVRAIAACDPTSADAVPVAALPMIDEWRAAGLGEVVDLDTLVASHAEVRLPVGLWHGDLTPWNMAAGPGELLIWDWEFAGRGRPVGFDLLHHRFEQHRRAPGGSSPSALVRVVAEVDDVVGPLGLTLDEPQRDALVGLYLAELAARELRLGGQRWEGPQADLGPAVIDALRRRTARS